MLYMPYGVLGACCTWCMLYLVYGVLSVCCTRWMVYLVYTVLGVYCTWCILYSGYAVLGVWCTRCMRCLVSTHNYGKERDDLTLCSAMMVELSTRKREGDEN
jgi:hypothetical protein